MSASRYIAQGRMSREDGRTDTLSQRTLVAADEDDYYEDEVGKQGPCVCKGCKGETERNEVERGRQTTS